MDSQDQLRCRGGNEVAAAAAEAERKNANDDKGKRDKKRAMAKRGLRSLAIAVVAPALITLFAASFFGSSQGSYGVRAAPIWFPPVWAQHAMCIGSRLLLGLAAWLVWAEGGFHRKPEALYLYLAQIGLCLAWSPIVFRMGASRVGLVVWLGMCGSLLGCHKLFKQVNPIAGDLVKPCLAWAALVFVVNLKLAMV